MRDVMPVLSRIVIFPIKALAGVERQTVRVLPTGALEHDRTWAMVDGSGGYVNGKRCPAVHRLRSELDVDARIIALSAAGRPSATFHIDGERRQLEQWLRHYFGFAVTLEENRQSGFPDDTDSPGPTVISVATLREIGRWFGLPVEQVRARLRTNIEIDGVPPFWEDGLFGAAGSTVRFRLGRVRLQGVNPCQRCVVPPRDPVTGANDDTFVRRFAELRRQTLPPWSTRDRFNHYYRVAVNTRLGDDDRGGIIEVGDPIAVIDSPSLMSDITRQTSTPAIADFWAGDLVVDEIVDETPTVKTFRLRDPAGGALPFRFRPGQFLTVTIGNGPERMQRCYTIASSAAEQGFCEITVKREGAASALLHDRIDRGTRLAVSGPMGRFVFDGTASDKVVFIAGGVGITPLMSHIRFLVGQGWPGRIDLFYSVKTSREIIFHDELRSLRGGAADLRVHLTVTAEDGAWTGRRGRLTPAWIASLVPDIADCAVRLCGPAAMAGQVRNLMRSLGVPDGRFDAEAFGQRNKPGEGTVEDRDLTISFRRSGSSASAAAMQTLLDVAVDAGIPLDHGCRAGVCGRCRVRLIEGDVAADNDLALAPDDRAAGLVLACQARPLSDIVLDC